MREVDMEPADDRSGHGVVIRRAGGRWVVEARLPPVPGRNCEPVRGGSEELISALVLADLLAEEFDPGSRPAKVTDPRDENARLKLAITQLEHALAARVLIEQAIGVLAERGGWLPRDAFDQLRRTARSLGRKVHELAGDVVASVTDPAVRLPEDLPRRSVPPVQPPSIQ
jgi:hypothetical protein